MHRLDDVLAEAEPQARPLGDALVVLDPEELLEQPRHRIGIWISPLCKTNSKNNRYLGKGNIRKIDGDLQA